MNFTTLLIHYFLNNLSFLIYFPIHEIYLLIFYTIKKIIHTKARIYMIRMSDNVELRSNTVTPAQINAEKRGGNDTQRNTADDRASRVSVWKQTNNIHVKQICTTTTTTNECISSFTGLHHDS